MRLIQQHQTWHLLLALTLGGLLAGCESKTPPSKNVETQNTPLSSKDVSAGLGTLPTTGDALQLHHRLTDEISNVDPNEGGWESEAFTETANEKMKQLAKLLMHPEKLNGSAIENLTVADIAVGSLHLEALDTVSESDAIKVGRFETAEKQTSGRQALVAELKSLAEVISSTEEIRAKFKVMHVELTEGGTATTRLLFEYSGRNAKGWTQIKSTWHCNWTQSSSDSETPLLSAVNVSDYQLVEPGKNGRIEFVDAAAAVLSKTKAYASQLTKSFDYWRARSDRSLVADLLGAQGVIVGDVNGDHLDDLYVLQPGGLPNRLLLHQPDGTALDVSAEAGVDVLDFCRSALFVDLDNDGDQDLVLGLAWAVAFFENDGAAQFTRKQSIPSDGQINSMAAADYDNDGDIDIFLCGRDASGEIKAEQGALGIPMPYYDANNGGPNTLLRNEGAFAFTDATKIVGMDINNRRFSLACAWEDFDNDGDQDLYVSNDFGRNNLWRNDIGSLPGSRIFVDIAEQTGVVDIGPGMSAAWGDHNSDGYMDLYVGNMWSNAGNRITLQQQFLPGATEATKRQARRHARGNSVYVNNGDGTFRDVTQQSGANMARWAWSSNFIDLNNDGRQDLVVANGMITAGDTGDL